MKAYKYIKKNLFEFFILCFLSSQALSQEINNEIITNLTCIGEDTLHLPSGNRKITQITPDVEIKQIKSNYLITLTGLQLGVSISVHNVINSSETFNDWSNSNKLHIERTTRIATSMISIDRISGNLSFSYKVTDGNGNMTILFGRANCKKSQGRIF